MPLTFASKTASSIPVHLVAIATASAFLDAAPAAQAAQARLHGFSGKLGQTCLLHDADGALSAVFFGMGDASSRARGRFPLAALPPGLPDGTYHLAGDIANPDAAALAWMLSQYRFARYRRDPGEPGAHLVAPDGVDAARIEAIANSVALTRDLINTPANDMGPDALEAAFRALGAEFGAEIAVVAGDGLLDANFPMIHAVGRASDQAPRLLEMTWGAADHPAVTLVGKGVCFDTGGLNLKPGSSMGLMKKDMGGAARTMGLARMIMAARLPLRLRLLIPAVENAVSAGAFRPGDILTSRSGLTVEINNTDAEGRLVLADALALANETPPELMFCMATLTGAARVALGPDMPPFYTDDDGLADDLAAAAGRVADPIWRMPFHAPYEAMIEPGIADLDNAPAGGFAGSITAALFLRRFVPDTARFAHFDVFGWTPSAKPGRPKGGECQAARAIFDLLERRYGA